MHYATNRVIVQKLFISGPFFHMVAFVCLVLDFIGDSPVIGKKVVAGGESLHFFRHPGFFLSPCALTTAKQAQAETLH